MNCKLSALGGFILLSCTVLITPCYGQTGSDTVQRDLIDIALKLIKKEPPRQQEGSSRRVRFSIAPASTSQGRITLSAINLAFYRGDPANTNLSTTYFYPYTNFGGRYSFVVASNVWSAENKWNTTGDFKISSITYDDYGLGSSSSVDSVAQIGYNQFRAHLQISRLVKGFFYLGLGYFYDHFYSGELIDADATQTDFENYPYGTTEKNTSSGLVFNLLRDSRKNSINPDGGFYTNISYRFYHPAIGSTYQWHALFADGRKYFPIPTKRRSLIAVRTLYWGTWGEVPYFELPATFTDRESRMGRGYQYSRFRGGQMLYGEAEYRFSLSTNNFWGGVVFANVQSLTEPNATKFEKVNPAGGFGLRVKFNKRSNANVTLDFAFGKDSFRWYLNLGEFL